MRAYKLYLEKCILSEFNEGGIIFHYVFSFSKFNYFPRDQNFGFQSHVHEYTRNLEIMTTTRSFRALKSVEEEKELLEESIPKSTQNVVKWAVKIFADWQTQRENKDSPLEKCSFTFDAAKIQALDTDIVNMSIESLNFLLTKFIQEVCKKDGERYPRTYYLQYCLWNSGSYTRN